MHNKIIILGIETSCDETSVAVLIDGEMKSNIVSSQEIHSLYGGVVPELASRAHQKHILPIVDKALADANISKNDLTAIAVAVGPGLMGSLLVGVNFAKSLAYALNIPFISVNHMEAHIYSNFIDEPKPNFPFINLTVSGGHTQLVLLKDDFEYILLGNTIDDAAGEAFDKVAKILGLSYPGGPLIDKCAKEGDANKYKFPSPMINTDDFNFSFSGIKTSVLYFLRDENISVPIDENTLKNICASFQQSVIKVLIAKTIKAALKYNVKDIAVSGGVSANSKLRNDFNVECKSLGLNLFIPKLAYCTDNGAMIAEVGYRKYLKNKFSDLFVTANPNLEIARK